jgi:pentatricopeptide repeat protein
VSCRCYSTIEALGKQLGRTRPSLQFWFSARSTAVQTRQYANGDSLHAGAAALRISTETPSANSGSGAYDKRNTALVGRGALRTFASTGSTSVHDSVDTDGSLYHTNDAADGVVGYGSELAQVRSHTQHLLHDLPPGFLSGNYLTEPVLSWADASKILYWWIIRKTPESVERSVEILSALVREVDRLQVEDEDEDTTIRFLNPSLVESIVINWSFCWKRYNSMKVTPIILYEKLQECAAQLSSLELSGKALIHIIHGTVLAEREIVKSSSKTYATASFCDQVFRSALLLPYSPDTLTLTLNLCLKAWLRSGNRNGYRGDQRAEHATQLFEDALQAGVAVDAISYNTMLRIYADCGKGEHAQSLLDEWCRAYNRDPFVVAEPNLLSLNITLAAWSKSAKHTPDAASHAQTLLRRVWDPYDDIGKIGIQPDTVTLNTILSCWARSAWQPSNTAEKAQTMLQEMKSLFDSGELDVQPDVYSYTTAMNVFAKAGHPESAEELLNTMHQKYLGGDKRMMPTSLMHVSILEAWGRSLHPDRIEKAEYALSRMEELRNCGFLTTHTATHSNDSNAAAAYNVMLNTYVKADAVDKAEALLRRMMAHTDPVLPPPDGRTFSIVILALVRSPDGTLRAAELLDSALELYRKSGPGVFEFDIRPINAVISALSRKDSTVTQAVALIHRMLDWVEQGDQRLRPCDASYGPLLFALHKAQLDIDGAPYIAGILERFEKLHASGILPAPPKYEAYKFQVLAWRFSKQPNAAKNAHAVLKFLSNQARQGKRNYQPEALLYNAVLEIMAMHRLPLQAENLLQEMYNDYLTNPINAKPNLRSFNAVLWAWARLEQSSVALEHTRSLLAQMQRLHSSEDEAKGLDVEPDTISYNCVMSAWMNSRHEDAPTQIEHIFRHSLSVESVRTKPDQYSFTLVIQGWLRGRNIEKCTAALENMWQAYTENRIRVYPNPRLIQQAIALATVDDAAQVARLEALMLKIKKLPVRHRPTA